MRLTQAGGDAHGYYVPQPPPPLTTPLLPSPQVNETEYTEFYKSTFRAYDEPMAKTHFSLEGQVEFKALLYIPSVVRRNSTTSPPRPSLNCYPRMPRVLPP